MAIIRSVSLGARNLKPHGTEVDSEYQPVTRADGTVLLQISTFGSDDRMSKPKVSQTIQLDESAASQLMAAMKSVFPEIA